MEIGGKGSALHQKHKIHLDAVTVATPPENYQERLIPLFEGAWPRLHLFALEAHDLALSKLILNATATMYSGSLKQAISRLMF